MGTRNLSMPTMQNICQSGWFCKLNNVLLESTVALFLVFSVNTKNQKKIYKNTVYICKKKKKLFFIVLLLDY